MNSLFIFDLDGTLYSFDKGESKSFGSSKFYADIKQKTFTFFSERLGFPRDLAELEFNRIKEKYNKEVSLGVEREYGINRYEYFANTWNLNPKNYFDRNPNIRKLFEGLSGKIAILTGAPKVWAAEALQYLDVYDIIQNSLFTGEPDVRKPDPEAFAQIARLNSISPLECVSIGDQESTDIIPAKKLGMKTIIVGKPSEYADFQISKIRELYKILEKLENEKNNN